MQRGRPKEARVRTAPRNPSGQRPQKECPAPRDLRRQSRSGDREEPVRRLRPPSRLIPGGWRPPFSSLRGVGRQLCPDSGETLKRMGRVPGRSWEGLPGSSRGHRSRWNWPPGMGSPTARSRLRRPLAGERPPRSGPPGTSGWRPAGRECVLQWPTGRRKRLPALPPPRSSGWNSWRDLGREPAHLPPSPGAAGCGRGHRS